MLSAEYFNSQRNDHDDLIRAIKIIIQLYTDKAHFVYELLQNAEDCKATKFDFRMYADRLEVIHNGEPFDEANMKSLLSVAFSTKPGDVNAIGKFGVGFKSVFGICKTVQIYCDPSHYDGIGGYLPKFAYNIVNFLDLEELEEAEVDFELPKGYTTKFVFPFCVNEEFSGYSSMTELHARLTERLRGLGTSVLLFMKNIEEISYSAKGLDRDLNCSGRYMLEKIPLNNNKSCFKVNAAGENRDGDISYLLYSKPTGYGKDVNLAFACEWDNVGYPTFSPAPEKHVCVYFPTDKESKVNFVVQAPFGTTPNRGGIPDDTDNLALAKELSVLLKAAVLDIRDRGWLTLELLNLLPFDQKTDYSLLRSLHENARALLMSESVLPTVDKNKYTTKSLARIVRGEEISKLFEGKLLEVLEKAPEAAWMPTTLTEDSKPFSNLYSVLTEQYEIKVIRADTLSASLRTNKEFWNYVDDDWIISFYKYLLEKQPRLLGKSGDFATVPIIKTANNAIVAAYTYDQRTRTYTPKVYRTPQNAKNGVGKLTFAAGFIAEFCPKFLDAMEIGEPDGYAYLIEELTAQFNDETISRADELSQINRAIKYLKEESHDNAIEEFRTKLRLRYVTTYGERDNFTTNEKKTLFYKNDSSGFSIADYFSNINVDVGILDEDFYLENGIKQADLDRLSLLGVKNTVISYGPDNWSDGASCSNMGMFKKKLTFEFIDDILHAIYYLKDKNKSALVLTLLTRVEKHLKGVFLRGAYRKDEFSAVSDVVETLASQKWLWTRDGNPARANQITCGELDPRVYGTVERHLKIFSILGFRQDPLDEYVDRLRKLSVDQQRQIITNIAPLVDAFSEYDPTVDENENAFPEEEIKNASHLNRIVNVMKDNLKTAPAVQYEYKSLRVRTSRGNDREHIGHRYKGYCQMCESPSHYWEIAEIFKEPEKELPELNLSLCPTCAAKYRTHRNGAKTMLDFRKAIIAASVNDPNVPIDEDWVTFTKVHLAEIQTIVKEMMRG